MADTSALSHYSPEVLALWGEADEDASEKWRQDKIKDFEVWPSARATTPAERTLAVQTLRGRLCKQWPQLIHLALILPTPRYAPSYPAVLTGTVKARCRREGPP
jgi:hypothetical protein